MENFPINLANDSRADISNFTKDQKKAYDEILSFINSSYDDSNFKKALVGAAGTGKTYLVKALLKNCGMSYSMIGLSAPTHKACRVLAESIGISNIKVNTLQSDLGLKINFDVEKFDINNPPFDNKGRIKISDYKLYIVDESSMINRDLCTFLERMCKQNKCKILYIGDSYQLAPVNEKYSSCFKGLIACELKQIVRQGDDNPVKNLLELLRNDIKNKTFDFLNYISRFREAHDTTYTKGFKVCSPTEFNNIVYTNFSDPALTSNVDYVKIIAYTNVCVSGWNKYIRNAIIKDADKSIITKNDLFISYTTIVNQFNDCVIKNSEEYIVKDVVNYTHPKYNLKGFMVRFISIHGGVPTTPLFILDHKDSFSVQMYIKISNELIEAAKNCRPISRSSRWKEYYEFKESSLLLTNIITREGKMLFSRDLDYGFSLTSHKSQGSTFDTALVDVNDIVYDKNGYPYSNAEEINRRLYVACSRCRNNLYLKFGK